ncbi:hypothetical protein PUP66_19245 [Pseudomonas chlororaphis]|uniref:hypothetical protein n=1 Tax=Pseudomonas chlororaphis TaxID=587753 RepID=UPI000F712FBF|nr:hypothetical protein [Pseudomonas chlororaphis]AZD16618.1 hypothetical protein C4K25_3692 [Pseudomonas chlororaphis]WDH45243.1 hypothetical protein PUP66_19245 [Pseudomonas chlororaphis]WDH57089.1 hypothetical protein PUP56_19250 [Pseudomonas chlororaphis]WQE16348.1 hypothetical protein U0007_18060 [Pseudomonas chlororaphis]
MRAMNDNAVVQTFRVTVIAGKSDRRLLAPTEERNLVGASLLAKDLENSAKT